jgi:hypothetical protein
MPPLKMALKHLSLAMKEIEKMPEPVKAVKAVKSKSMGTSPMKEPKEPKMKKSKSMGTSTSGLTEKQKKLPAGLQKAIMKSKMSKDSPSYNM